jgi:hypothetical protein
LAPYKARAATPRPEKTLRYRAPFQLLNAVAPSNALHAIRPVIGRMFALSGKTCRPGLPMKDRTDQPEYPSKFF